MIARLDWLAPGEASTHLRDIGARSVSAPFRDAAWLDAWFAARPPESQVCAISLDAGGVTCAALIGVAAGRTPAIVGLQRVWLNESGAPRFDQIYSEYNDLFASSALQGDAGVDALDACIEGLLGAAPGFDELVIRNARPALAAAAEAVAARRGWRTEKFNVQSTWQVDLARIRGCADTFTASCGSSFRAKIRRTQRYFEQRGALRLVRPTAGAEKTAAFEALARLNARVWESRGHPGAFSDDHVRRFHETLMARSPDAVDIPLLYAGEELIGALYNLVSGTIVANYQSGFVYDAGDRQVSPGYLCHAQAIDAYAAEGFATYDLLAGGDHYKERLADRGETLTSLAIIRPSWRDQLRRAARGFRALTARSSPSTETRQT